MNKAQMIQAILREVVSAATVAGKTPDTTDLFFTLAFKEESALGELCKSMKINA